MYKVFIFTVHIQKHYYNYSVYIMCKQLKHADLTLSIHVTLYVVPDYF